MRLRCCSYSPALFRPAAAESVLVVGAHAGQAFAPEALGLPKPLAKELAAAAKAHGFVGAAKQQIVLRRMSEASLPCKAVVLLGLGKAGEITQLQWLRAAGTAARLARSAHAKSVVVALPGIADATEAPLRPLLLVAQGLRLGLYRFGACRAPAKGEDARLMQAPDQAVVITAEAHAEEGEEAARIGVAVAEAVVRARDWVNMPANLLGPAQLAADAEREAQRLGLTCKVLDEAALRKEKMGLLLGVGQGSQRPPKLVHLSYNGGKSGAAPIVLIGKGIVFDSGGLCIKPCESMSTMKMDMGGAAAVLATLGAAARLQLPIHVHAIMALAENMPSGHAIRPGDILTSAAGTTVEVNNTDAEGRLVLADAIHYAKRLAPAAIVDVATLTGACMVALGPTTAGLFSSRDALAEQLLKAAKEAGEDMWRMPLTKALRDQLKSDCADLRNTGERYGGAITAALFLQEFVGEVPWAHLDIAGPAWGSEEGAHMSKGGSGAAVATLVRFLMRHANDAHAQAEKAPAKAKRVRRRGG